MDEQPKILITRLSHIGDCVLTLPMVNRIKDRFPKSVISWAIEAPTQKLLAGHRAVDEFIVVPKAWMKSPSAWRDLRKQFKQRKFDIAIDPQGITKSAMLGWLSGAKTRIGIKGQWGRELSPWLNNRLVETRETHLVDRSLELLNAMTGGRSEIRERRFEFPLPEDAIEFCETFQATQQLPSFAVINPGASWASKRWDNERFGSVGSWLFRHQGIRSVLTWAGSEEETMVNQIAAFDPDAFVIAPPTNLPQLAAFLCRAKMFIGCDTGPLHIAAAVGTPCVGLYGTTRPRDSGAWPHAQPTPHVAVQKWHQSGSCRKRRSADNDAMMDILAADVFAACESVLLASTRKSA
jgi:ADP-heptose:LPS heptosyltransferase